MRGPLPEDTTLASAVATLQPDARLGNQRVAGAADFDGDGWPDLLVGDSGDAAGILRGEEGDTYPSYAGHTVMGAGDVDGDGSDDVAIEAYFGPEVDGSGGPLGPPTVRSAHTQT